MAPSLYDQGCGKALERGTGSKGMGQQPVECGKTSSLLLAAFAEDSARGTGWTFSPPTAEGMLGAVDRALEVRWHHPEAWQALMRNGMTADLSWNRAAHEYEQVRAPTCALQSMHIPLYWHHLEHLL